MKLHVCAVLVLAGAGCGSSPAMRAAESGDLAALQRIVSSREAAADLSTHEAASLARAVAGREIRSAPSPEALDRIGDVHACARELDSALEDRSKTADAAGVAAALARVDGGGVSLSAARALGSGERSPYRAVRVRGLVRAEDRAERLSALLDPDPVVRRQAARAARDAAGGADATDAAALGEVARLDPEPLVRTEAVRALAALPPALAADVARLLRDLWTAGDEGLREDLASALAAGAVWGAGGREALAAVLASAKGSAAIQAAAAVLRRPGADAPIVETGAARLARAIEEGSRVERLEALAVAPLDRPGVRDAVVAAASGDDLEVRAIALGRLVQAGDAARIPALENLGQPGSPHASAARLALAFAGDRRIQAWLEESLRAPSAFEREEAASALAALGVPARAAPLLADADASVRARAACTLLMAARR
jgi:hypothetical protein